MDIELLCEWEIELLVVFILLLDIELVIVDIEGVYDIEVDDGSDIYIFWSGDVNLRSNFLFYCFYLY